MYRSLPVKNMIQLFKGFRTICHSIHVLSATGYKVLVIKCASALNPRYLRTDINIQRYIRQTHIGSILRDYHIIAKRKGNPIFLSESFMTTYLSHMHFDSHSAIFYIFL